MDKIVILDTNGFTTQHIQNVLETAGLADMCVFQSESRADSSVHISVGPLPDSGAAVYENDRFPFPFRIGAFLDRVQKHADDLANGPELQSIEIGPFTLNTISSCLTNNLTEDEIRLTEKEKHILVYLSQNSPSIIHRQALLDEVWGYAESVETHTLETHIYRLRQKIEKDPAAPEILLTEEHGYRLA